MIPEQTDLVRRLRELGVYSDVNGAYLLALFAEAADMIEALAGGWQPIATAPTLDRVFVAGIQPRSGNVIAYWWMHEDHTDERGVPMDHPNALMWQPLPAPPEVMP